MRKYLVTIFSREELRTIAEYYRNWNVPMMRDTEENLRCYQRFQRSAVDTICLFARWLNEGENFEILAASDLYVATDGIYYWSDSTNGFRMIESDSSVSVPRIWWMDKEYLAFLQAYAVKAFGIRFDFSYDFSNTFLSTKRFGMYWWLVSGESSHIPYAVLPLMTDDFSVRAFVDFLTVHSPIGNEVILKMDGSSGGSNIYVFDTSSSKDRNNLRGTLETMKTSGRRDIVCMRFLPTRDYEIRLLWAKENSDVTIVAMYKKVRMAGQILHNVSQGNSIAELAREDAPSWLEASVMRYCAALPDRHWGLDIILDTKGNYYFTENNALTWYLDEELERPFLDHWFDALVRTHTA